MNNFITFTYFIIFFSLNHATILVYNSYEYLSTVRLNNYNGYYGNANLLRYSIPINTVVASWFFQVRAAPTCPNTPVYIYLEYAGYPVVAPLNETFPTGFNINRLTKTLSILSIAGGGGSIYGLQNTQINVYSPKAGYWYTSVFYLNKGDKYASSCNFYLASLTNIWINNDTISITPNKAYFYNNSLNTYQTYKYYSTSNYNDPITVNFILYNDTSVCSLKALLREGAQATTSVPFQYDSNVTCNTQSSTICSLGFDFPLTNTWYYLSVSATCNYSLTLSVTSLAASNPIKTVRFISSTTFITKYYLSSSSNNLFTFNTDSTPYFFEFLFDQSNMGGTLILSISNRVLAFNASSGLNIYLNACLMFNTINKYTTCSQGYKMRDISYTLTYTYLTVNIPYPMSGNWYLALWRECFNQSTNLSVPCPSTYTQSCVIQMSSDQCANNYCGDYGVCNVLNSQSNIFSTCKCSAGYQGYGCTDDSAAEPISGYVGKVLFLTLSNLVFLFPVFLALHRRWYIESLMYTFSMFFSTFYHACDQQFFSFCIFNYNGLQLADFIGAYSSFVITMLSMAAIPRLWKLFTYFLGILLCMSVNLHDRFSTSAFIGLIVISAVFTISTWAFICWKKRVLYPKRRTLLFYLPGLAMAITGIVIYSSLGNENNYWILHSIWHMLIAFSIIFFMPKCEGRPLFSFIKRYFIKKTYPVNSTENNQTNQNNSNGSENTAASSDPQSSSISLSTQLSDAQSSDSKAISSESSNDDQTENVSNRSRIISNNQNNVIFRKENSKNPVENF